MVAFNVLRSIGQEVVALTEYAPKKITVTRWRLKPVLQEVIYSACRIVSHAGRFFLNFGSHCPWFDVYSRLPQALESPRKGKGQLNNRKGGGLRMPGSQKSPEIGAFERQWMQNLLRIGVVPG